MNASVPAGRVGAVCALLALLIVGLETVRWPLDDYPGAMWHARPRGDDIEIALEKAAVAGPSEIMRFWTGPTIVENGYFRPLASTLFVLQYRLFGREDWLWQLPSLVAHLLVAVAIVLVSGRVLGRNGAGDREPGATSRGYLTGLLAAIFFGAPGMADREIERWALGWWPCQPDLYTLLCLVVMLGLADAYRRRPGPSRGCALAACFLLAVSFKEMGFLVGVAGCLFLVRQPRNWGMVALLALEGCLLFAYRWWALEGATAPFPAATPARVWIGLGTLTQPFAGDPGFLLLRLLPALAALLVLAGRRRLGPVRAAVIAAGAWVVPMVCIFGSPLELDFWFSARFQWDVALRIALVGGLGSAVRRWPVAELVVIYLLAVLTVAGFPPTFGHYRYWSSILSGWLAAIAVAELLRLAIARWAAARPADSLQDGRTGAWNCPPGP